MLISSSYRLNGIQKNTLHKAVAQAPRVPDFARTGDANPNLRVAVLNFDGTNNDRDNVPKGSRATLISDSFETFRDSDNAAIASFYYRGVGNSASKVRSLIESAFGVGCDYNAEIAYSELLDQVNQWRSENPNIEVHVHATGFSRGAATALHFLNIVDQRGLMNKSDTPETAPTVLTPHRVQTSGVLLDTVSTGQGSRLDLTVPDSCVALLHITAANEQRHFFPLREIIQDADKELSFATNVNMPGASKTSTDQICYQRVREVELPGVHSDVGGSYLNGGIREVSKYLMENFQASLGLDVRPQKVTAEKVQNCSMHDSLGDWKLESFLVGHEEGDVENLLRQRAVEKVQKNTRGDDIVEQLRVTDARGESKNTSEISLIGTHPLARDMIGTPISVTIAPKSTLIPKGLEQIYNPYGMTIYTDKEDACEIQRDGLYILGRRVQSTPELLKTKEIWNQQLANDEEPRPVKVSFDIHHMGVYIQANQVPGTAPKPPEPQKKDPWPNEIQDAIILINSKQEVDVERANQIMFRCQRAVARALQKEFISVKDVTISPITKLTDTGDGSKLINSFAISIVSKDGAKLSSEAPLDGRWSQEFANRMREMKRGLAEVSEGLRAQGYQPARNAMQTFEPDKGSIYNGQKLMSLLDEPGQSPVKVNNSFMQMMGLFTSNHARDKHDQRDTLRI